MMAIENVDVQKARTIIAGRQREIANNVTLVRERERRHGEMSYSGRVLGYGSGRENYDRVPEKEGEGEMSHDERGGKRVPQKFLAYSMALRKGKEEETLKNWMESKRQLNIAEKEYTVKRRNEDNEEITRSKIPAKKNWANGKSVGREERRGIMFVKKEGSMETIVCTVLERVKRELSEMIADVVRNQIQYLLGDILGELRGREVPSNMYVVQQNLEEDVTEHTEIVQDLLQIIFTDNI